MNPHTERNLFAPGCFVMLHHDSKASGSAHPDAGRIGCVVSDEPDMVVEFWRDELVASSTFCLIPRRHWAPVPEFLVEEYEPRAKKRGWRLNAKGARMFQALGWQQTRATRGEV